MTTPLEPHSSPDFTRTFVNPEYEADTEFVVKVARKLLTPIGIWPRLGGKAFSNDAILALRIWAIFALMCFLLVPHFIYTILDAHDLRRLMKVIAAQVFSSLAVLKFWTFVYNKRYIRSCLEEMEVNYRDVESKNDLEIMRKNAKIGRFFTTAYLGLSYGGALPYHIIMPLLEEKFQMADNSTRIPLPYLTDFVFFDAYVIASPFYELLYVIQIIISSIILSTNCGVYSLIASCVMHSCALFEVAGYQMTCVLNDGLKTDDVVHRLHKIIKMHNQAIEFAERIENALNIVILSEMGGCTIIICFLEYGVLLDLEENNTLGVMTYTTLMTSIFVNVFILSFIGDRLKEKSAKIGECIYSIEWFGLPKKVAVDLMFIIMRANQPTKLTAGKLFDLSLQGFCDVCKTSMAYLNFLRTLEIT